MPLTFELIRELQSRGLLGLNEAMNHENALALNWCCTHYPTEGVPNHLFDGVEELMQLPRTERVDRSICWISFSALRAYEEVAATRGVRLFDDVRRFDPREVGMYVDVVFDGGPGPDGGRFVEVEDGGGRSISLGEWIKRAGGYWALRIPRRG